MEFNQARDVFVVTREEQALFRLPEGSDEWPHAQSGALLDRIGLVEMDLADANPCDFSPTDRACVTAEMARRAALARQARHEIARYAVLAETDFDRLLAQ
jgi:hypothetical protein